jgi:beta-aspartyl-peptidase (threonine type)
MRTLFGLLLFAAPVRADDAADARAVRTVLDDQVLAWNKGDLDGFMAGYWNSDDLTFISGGTLTRGWKATKERYEKRYKADGKEMGALAFSDLHVEVLSPTAALVRGKFELVFAKETDPKKKTASGRYTLIVKKIDGAWKVTHDHTSADDPK